VTSLFGVTTCTHSRLRAARRAWLTSMSRAPTPAAQGAGSERTGAVPLSAPAAISTVGSCCSWRRRHRGPRAGPTPGRRRAIAQPSLRSAPGVSSSKRLQPGVLVQSRRTHQIIRPLAPQQQVARAAALHAGSGFAHACALPAGRMPAGARVTATAAPHQSEAAWLT